MCVCVCVCVCVCLCVCVSLFVMSDKLKRVKSSTSTPETHRGIAQHIPNLGTRRR